MLDAIDGTGGYVLRGSFDELDRPDAFGALITGLRRLVQEILTESDAQLARWRTELRAGLADNAGVLVARPRPEGSSTLSIGKQPAVPPLAPVQAQARLRIALDAFIDAACQPGRPLAIVLDDLHKADDASLALVGDLAIDDTRAHLMLALAYRTDANAPVLPLLDRIEARIAPIKIALGPLDADDLARDFARRFADRRRNELADIVHGKTGGKPFAVRQFLRTMVDAGAITYRRGWTWDATRLAAASVTDDVAMLVGAQLAKLPASLRRLVATAACIGERFAVTELARVADTTPGELLHELDGAVRAGIVAHAGGGFRFAHDRVRAAALALLDRADQDRIHLQLYRGG